MENASKALIISGAVLIAIALISMGVYIISSQKGSIDNSKELSDTLEVNTFNSTFTKYTTGLQKGSKVGDLLTEIQTNNNRNTKTISVNEKSDTSDINDIKTKIKPNKNYQVSVTDYSNGYVSGMSILNSDGTSIS